MTIGWVKDCYQFLPCLGQWWRLDVFVSMEELLWIGYLPCHFEGVTLPGEVQVWEHDWSADEADRLSPSSVWGQQ